VRGHPSTHAVWLALGAGTVVAASATGGVITLEECARHALERSPSIRAAAFDAEAAIARVRAARASYAPRFEAHSEYGRSEGFDSAVTNGGSTQGIVHLEATLFDGGARRADVAGAEAHVASAGAAEKQRRADLLFEVRSAYFQAVAADREAEIHREAISTFDDNLRVLGAQATIGVAPENDLLRGKLAIESERTAERAARSEAEQGRAALSSLTGLELSGTSLAEPTERTPRQAGEAALDSSPLLDEARAELAAAEREADAVRAERSGHVTLSADAGALGVRPADTFEHDGGGQFLVGFTVPLFDGGARAARLAAAVAAANSARAKLEEARRALRLSWARAEAEARRAREDAAAARRTVELAREHFELMRARHAGGGNVRLLDVLDALTQSVEAPLSEARAKLAERIALAAEDQLAGEGEP
jgi:outer membrane protein TolC